MTDPHWNPLLRDQIDWHQRTQLRARLAGLTDREYFWEPVPSCWNVRPRGTGSAPVRAGSGAMTIDFAFPPPEPPPLTTIAWRLGHVIVGVLAMRSAAHFGRAPVDYQSFESASNCASAAAAALAQFEAEYATWMAGVESLGEDGLLRPCGPSEGPHADEPMATLVLHIHRELIHHLAEVSLLRDLYAHLDGNPPTR